MNDYCIHLNRDCQTRQACASCDPLLWLSSFLEENLHHYVFFFFKQRHWVTLSSLHTTCIYSSISLLLCIPMCFWDDRWSATTMTTIRTTILARITTTLCIHLWFFFFSFHWLPMNPVLPNRHLLDVDPRRLSMINAASMSAAGHSIHQRRTSIINYHQRRNSQLRKASFTTSILVCDRNTLDSLLDIVIQKEKSIFCSDVFSNK